MLRASSDRTGRPSDLHAVVDPMRDPLVPAGPQLLAFADAAVLRDPDEMPTARQALLDAAGPEGVVRAAAVAGNFDMMNRLLDATGVVVPKRMAVVADELGLRLPDHLRPR